MSALPEEEQQAALEVALDEPNAPLLSPHDPYAALRFRDYRLFSIGWLFATVGFQMQSATIGWEIYEWTGSAMKMGLAGGIQALPLILLALPAGHVADKYDRRLITIIGAFTAAICSIALAILSFAKFHGMVPTGSAVIIMYWIIFAGGIFSTFSRPARSALLPQLVPARAFPNAVTWSATIFEVSSVAGPALAGFIIWLRGAMTVYAVSAICTGTFLIFLLMLHHRRDKTAVGPTGPGQLMAGIRFVFQTKIVLAAMTLDLFAVLLGGATYLLPIFAGKDFLNVGPVGFGWLRAAPSMGAFSMALFLAHRRPMRHAGRSMLFAVAGFGLATIVFGLSKWFSLSMIALYFAGAFDNISVVVRHTLVQLMTPDSMRGRVSAVNAVFIGASNELGGMESGLTAAWFGPLISVVGGGIGTLLVVIIVALTWPQVRKVGSLNDARPAE